MGTNIGKAARRAVNRKHTDKIRARKIRKGYGSLGKGNESYKKIPMRKTFLASDDVRDFVVSDFFISVLGKGMNVPLIHKDVLCVRAKWNEFVRDTYQDYQIMMQSEWSGIIIGENCILEYATQTNSVSLNMYGTDTSMLDKAMARFSTVGSQIEWVYSERGDSIYIPLNLDRLPVDEMYPFLGTRTLEEYYDSYLNSNSNILILIGAPGTGKSSFVRGLLAYAETSALVTYDPAVLERDSIFANFIQSENTLMILEDSDNFLRARSEGNNMMQKFLNLGDGLVSTKNKKLIFTTNLPNVRDIDSALLRPGRCFDVVNFDLLTQEQADTLAAVYDIELRNEKKLWTIAEVFNEPVSEAPKNKVKSVGFF